mgnify:CR=1 FL=1
MLRSLALAAFTIALASCATETSGFNPGSGLTFTIIKNALFMLNIFVFVFSLKKGNLRY